MKENEKIKGDENIEREKIMRTLSRFVGSNILSFLYYNWNKIWSNHNIFVFFRLLRIGQILCNKDCIPRKDRLVCVRQINILGKIS